MASGGGRQWVPAVALKLTAVMGRIVDSLSLFLLRFPSEAHQNPTGAGPDHGRTVASAHCVGWSAVDMKLHHTDPPLRKECFQAIRSMTS